MREGKKVGIEVKSLCETTFDLMALEAGFVVELKKFMAVGIVARDVLTVHLMTFLYYQFKQAMKITVD